MSTAPAKDRAQQTGRQIRFDRHEFAGAVGDLGTDLPLLMGMIVAAGLDPASTFLVFGAFQVLTGVVYGLPMPVQPLKAIAAIVIAGGAPKEIVFGAGLVLGVVMTVLALTNVITPVARLVPHGVVRGIQFGLGMSLMLIAMRYVQRDGGSGVLVAVIGVMIVLISGARPRVPSALLIVAFGIAVAWISGFRTGPIFGAMAPALPALRVPALDDIFAGALRLAVPQIPLSLANSLMATAVLLRDFFPDRPTPGIRRITLTYGIMNLVAPFVSGVPVCHGCGGLAGHYRFGARTGGSVIIYGAFYLMLGGLFSQVSAEAVKIFPFPLLGVLLLFEGLALVRFIGDVSANRDELAVALLVGAIILGLPYGYAIGALAGAILFRLLRSGRVSL